MRLLIVGGTRFIGAELVRQAVDQGHDVTVLSLDKPSKHVRWLKANRDAPLADVFSRLTFDTVIDNIAFGAQQVNHLIDALRGKVNRYVLTSSVDIYCNQKPKHCDEFEEERLEPFLHSDGLPQWESYVRGKRRAEIALRNSRHLDHVVIRPAVTTGSRDNIMCPVRGPVSRSLFFPLRIADGGPILLRHTDTRLHQMVFVEDVAVAMLLAATHPSASGQVLNVVGDEVWTNEKLVYWLSAACGRATDVLRVTNSQLDAQGLNCYQTPYSRSLIHAWSLFSNARLKRLGWTPTPATVWARTLFCSADAWGKSNPEERRKELRVALRIIGKIPVSMTFRLPGRFHTSHAISSIGIGTHHGAESLEDDRAYFLAIRRAVAGGINLIDTAINYRGMRSEQVVGKAVQRLVIEGKDRSSLCVVTKGGFVPPTLLGCGLLTDAEVRYKHSIRARYIALSLQHSICNLGLEAIDTYLLHNPEVSLQLLDEGEFYDNLIETFAMLEQRARDGVIGTYGIATWNGLRTPLGHKQHLNLNRIIACSELAAGGRSKFTVVELPFNDRLSEAATVRSQELHNRHVSSMDLAAARGLTVLTSSSVMSGRSDPVRALQFVLSYPQVSSALVGMRQPDHVDRAVVIMKLARGAIAGDKG